MLKTLHIPVSGLLILAVAAGLASCSGPEVVVETPVEPATTYRDLPADEVEVRIRTELALALVDENQYRKTWEQLEVVFDSGADSWWLHLAAAQVCLYWSLDRDCVRTHGERALVLRPDNARAYLYLAQVAQDEGNSELAISLYTHGLTLRPGEIDISLQLASLFVSEGERDRAIEVIENALQHDRRNPRLLLRLASVLEPDDPTRAEELYLLAIDRLDDPILASNHLIRFYIRQGREAEAERLQTWVREQVGGRNLRPLR